jgi:ceramide glucosyltransferase
LENFLELTLASSFWLDYPRYEVIFCDAHENDPAVPLIERLIAMHPNVPARLLVGRSTVAINPKLDNIVKGWHAASHDWIVMADSNVGLPADYLQRLFAVWDAECGLVCSPPIGASPQNFAAHLECAFLNTHQARWQCFADSIGFGFAQGKTMLWQRQTLEDRGGIAALASEVAEDAAATKLVRSSGLHVRLARAPFPQPLGRRRLRDVWRRQLRWAKLRRSTFPVAFLPECLCGVLPALVCGAVAAAFAEVSVVLTFLSIIGVWYGAEMWLARIAGWPASMRTLAASMLRDALLPAVWTAAWLGDEFDWRGNDLRAARRERVYES